jgi:hypothetical protein
MFKLSGLGSRFLRAIPIFLTLVCTGAVLLSHPRSREVRPQGTHEARLAGLDFDAAAHPLASVNFKPIRFHKLNCSPAPCVLPNVDVSPGPKPVEETPVTVNPKNPQQLVALANDANCGLALGISTSDDGGTTWTPSCMGPVGTGASVDPIVGYDLQGNAYVGGISAGNTSAIVIRRSADNGKTWSPTYTVIGALLGLADKPWLQVDTTPTSPYANSLYVSVSQNSYRNTLFEISVSHSNDEGKTWKTTVVGTEQVFPQVEELTDMAIGSDGTVYLSWLHCTFLSGPVSTCAGTPATYELSKSVDGGNTWSEPQAIFTTKLGPKTVGGLCGYGCLPNTKESIANIPVIAIDNSNGAHKGNLYVAYGSWTGTFMRVLVATSVDGGATWSHQPVASSAETHDQFFPWVSVSPSGIVGVSWLDRRNDPSNIKYEAFAAFSRNGGKSFGENIQLSAALSDPANDGYNGDFMGDYTGNAWGGNNRFYVTYTDTTTGVGQDFVGGYRLK